MSVGNGTLLTFSPEGERLAQSGVDGVLKIWDVRTGQLEQEYQPAAHLVAGATCIKFSPVAHQCNGEAEESTPGKKKKKKKKDVAYEQRYSLVAMGSKNGNVLLYSPENRELVTQLSHSPPHPILDIAWLSPTRLFSLANDTLVLWNVNTGKRVYTCEVSSGVVSICAFGAKEVCVGSSKIQDIRVMKKGDIGTAKERKNFTGHTSKTIQLLPILGTDVATKYFFSAAKDDRFIYAWNLNGEGEEPCANFLVKDAVYSMAVGSGTQDNVVSLAVTTRKGALVYFTEHLNGNLQKRVVKLKGKLTVCSESDGVKQPVPILASCFLNDIENSIMIVYGNASFMKFERLKVEQLTGKQELVRQVKTASSSSSRGMEKKPSKTVTPKVTEEANILGPSNITLPEGGEAKRKRDDPDGKATLPMEERLSALAIDKVTPHSTLHGPRSDDQVHLLLQGLQSKDHQLLHPVLSCNSSEVINNTVKRLPSQAVAPLLRYLQQAIEDKGVRHYSYVPWLRGVLYHHMSFLSTLPDREALVLPFYRLAMSTMSSLVQMMQLQARLDLLLTHVTTRHQGAKEQQQDHPALLTYEDDSSSDDYLLPGASESEDNWDELSEFGGDINGHTDDSDMEVDPDATTSSSKNKRKKDSASSPDDDDDDDDDEPTALESDSESNSKDNDNQDSECESEEEEEEEKENEEEVDEEEEEEEEEENEEDEEEDEEEEEENEDEEEERRGRRRN
ncbi:hypothetical protein Pcinc_010376 [Petrolisthes cinctipes]|uniref:Small-subunit processome Utp12 domain-containing protein n=1 Tax=Petrolisthes cinctipes TaxID=88211 RepID=A0AAE1G5I5_PETCI|nr:hypothetical protein Pcinc_010376 [Petrolisthes cinctipes]